MKIGWIDQSIHRSSWRSPP